MSLSHDAFNRRRTSPTTPLRWDRALLDDSPRGSSKIARIGLISKSSRQRFIAVVVVALVGLAWFTLRSTPSIDITLEGPERQRNYAKLLEENDVDVLPQKTQSPHEPMMSNKLAVGAESDIIKVNPRPISRPPARDPNIKYLAYHPHSVSCPTN